MAWSPNDLVSDVDLVAYERTILTQFGEIDWQAKRQKALEDWLFPLMVSVGLDPYRLRTRYQPDQVWGLTSSAYTDYTEAAQNATSDDIPVASVLASSSDALVIGSTWQFRGVSMRLHEDVSITARTPSVELWRDTWKTVAISDGTQLTAGVPFSKGGAMKWTVPEDWVVRAINDSPALYYARVKLSGAPTGAALGQMSVIRRSSLCAAATLKTLQLIFREAPIQQDGPWERKAEDYGTEAQHAWERSLPMLGREFDTDTVDDVIDKTEATQTTDTASGGGWSFDRC